MSTHGDEPDLWLDLRVRLAESLLVAMLQEEADPSVAPALHRLLLVAGLAPAVWQYVHESNEPSRAILSALPTVRRPRPAR
ncbi:hypothetical protein OG809_22710 [Kribbella soli]